MRPRQVFNRRRLISTGLKLGATALVGYGVVRVCQFSSVYLRPHYAGVYADPNFTPPPTPVPNYVFDKHTGAVTSVAWSWSSEYITSGSADKTALVWRASDGALVYKFIGYQYPVTSVTWSSDSMCIASSGADDGSVQVWDATDNKDIRSYTEQAGKALSLSWSVMKSLIASGGEDKSVHIWDGDNGKPQLTLHGHTGSVRAVAWSPFGATNLASASSDTTVRTWGSSFKWEGIYSPKDIVYRGHSAGVNALAWSRDGKMIASASDDGTVQVWNAKDGSHVVTYRGHKGPVNAVAWLYSYNISTNRSIFWLASGGEDTTVQVWELSGKRIATYARHTKPIRSLASGPFTSDLRIASASDDGTVHIWTVSNE